MGISPGRLKPGVSRASETAADRPALVKILHRKIVYGGWFVAMLVVCLVSSAVVGVAQEERPQIIPGERKPAKKKESGPRAVAVLQMASNGKATLVPIAILVNGKFWDATAYKADPIPMALESGTVYEAERAGSSLGLFTVNSALHSNAVNVQSPWIGTGKWVPAGAEKEKKPLKADKVPVGIDTSDEPPRLTKNPGKETPAAPASGTAPSSNAPPSTPPQSTPPSDSGDGPPRLTRHDDPASEPPSAGSTQHGQSQPGSASAPPTTPSGSKPSDTKPADAKPAEAKQVDRPAPPPSDSGADSGNRPKLRRGKPVEPLPEDEVPGYSKPGASAPAASTANAAKAPDAGAQRSVVDSVPAISDATGPIPRSFAFEWLKDEEGERRQQMVALAKDQVRAYVSARTKANIVPKPTGAQAARRTVAPKTKDPILENVQMSAYDLWTTNQPILILSAEAHMPPPPAGTAHSEIDSDLQYSIVLVAYPDIYNNLHKVYVGVTDKFHLDMTPQMQLIDAVDADGDGRGELLFREISDAGNGWVIYRATADKLWKMFDSLHPE